ncbi:hypothetical protein FVEG_02365 [Fusarium verticillioides 7600]|uniref:Protein YOP1 n=2 Tax=Gibberella moniliformis (strain M3125 / FGSC 7600) TaxID=334819 RepID=W7LJN0_GIBM7|nr:hypothetical protein FVEG_02365 [Fusarium verticillioides 7600]EWG39598.1 hypothetical protein FVEG_02365 [Fusarium verticillioides 7600]
MFDLFPMLLSSVACYLFPIFASYKALKTHDPTQLTPWLMYWVVLSCCLLAESWVWFIVSWIPLYGYFRLLFLLYLILPQTQGARRLYEEYVHPYLEKNETQIDDFIASAHERLTAAGISYLKLAIEQFKVKVLGLPPSEPESPPPEPAQGYTQSLLSRFNVPAARWAGNTSSGTDFYSLLSSAVAAATNAGAGGQSTGTRTVGGEPTNSGALIPPHLRESGARMDFISAQRDRLNVLISALDREAQDLRTEAQRAQTSTGSRRDPMAYGGYDNNEEDEPTQRPPSGLSGWSGISKSRSETDFERIDAETSSDEDHRQVRRRNQGAGTRNASGSWVPWGWGGDTASGGGASASGRER